MKKTLKKAGSLLIALAMLLAMSVPAFAYSVPENAITSIDLNKDVEVGDHLSVPAATFEFKIESVGGAPSDALTWNAGFGNSVSVNKGATGILLQSAINLDIDASKFTVPGVYTYKVTEDGSDPVDGYTYDTSAKYVHLYIYNNPEYDSSDPNSIPMVCYSAIITDSATQPTVEDDNTVTGKLSSIDFKNIYKEKNDGKLIHVTVKKEVTGNQGDQNKEFAFTVSLSGLKTERNIIIVKPDGSEATIAVSGTTGSGTVTLKHGESFTIHGLNEGETYSIVETQQEGYKGKVDTGDFGAADANVTLSTQTVGTTHAEHTFTNDKTGTIPTGIFLNYKPYWIMGAIALVLAVFFFARRRNRFADEF